MNYIQKKKIDILKTKNNNHCILDLNCTNYFPIKIVLKVKLSKLAILNFSKNIYQIRLLQGAAMIVTIKMFIL